MLRHAQHERKNASHYYISDRSPETVRGIHGSARMTRSSGPAGFRNIDNYAVGGAVLHFGVDMLGLPFAQTERVVDIVANRRSRGGELLIDIGEFVDFEADMVQSGVLFTRGHAGGLIVCEFQDSQIDVAVGEVIALRARTVDFGDFTQAEHVDVKLRGFIRVLSRDRNMLDLRHGTSL